MGEDLRADIAAALSSDEGSTPEVDTSVDTSAAEPAPAEAAPVEPKSDGTVRDALGRFVPKAKASDTDGAGAATEVSQVPPTATTDGAPVTAAPAPAEAVQAPSSWGPSVRQHWGTLNPEVQQQIVQRETQMQRWANETAPLRQAGEAFMQAVQPFQMAIQAEGVDPITAVTNLMQIGNTLRFGTPIEKAATVAKIVNAYGVDIRSLDSALAGESPPPGTGAPDASYVQQAVQQALAPLMQAAQQRQQAEAQRSTEAARTELQTFAADAKNEFFNDVRGDMADLIEVAARNGRDMPLAEAYQRACMLHPEVSRVMLARQQGVNAQALTQAAKTARSAAVSVKGAAPVGNPERREPTSVRESIEAAIAAHSRV